MSQEERTKLREGVPYVKLYCIITAYTRSIATLEISERSYTNKMRSAVKTIVNKIVTTSGVNPHELVKCGSENISLDIKFV